MKSRPSLGWGTFLLLLALPTALLTFAAVQVGADELRHTRRVLFESRVADTTRIRQEIELAILRSGEILRAIPADATPDMAAAAIATATNAYEVGFVSREGTVDVPVPLDPNAPASDAAVREAVLRNFRTDSSVAIFVRSPSLHVGTKDVRHLNTSSMIVALRDLRPNLRVGFVLDASTVAHGAARALPPQERLDVVAPANPMSKDVTPPVNDDQILHAADDKVVRIFMSAQPGKVPAASAEDATRITLGRDLVFSVVDKDPTRVEHIIKRQRRLLAGIFFGCVGLMNGLAIWMFARARKAQRLADLRTDFVAAVSHELRTPLASVRMFAELLEAGDIPEDERAEVERTLAGETRRLHATLDRMLRFGALARGKLVIAKSKQRVAPLIEEAAKKRQVRIDIDPGLEANVDGELLGLAVDNLLSNAAKYAPADEDGPHLVRVRVESGDLWIDVIDHGPGLSKKALKKVFLPFERADQRLSRATEGSGVGLALVRGIAQAHGGDAMVASELGEGATFTLRLPCS